MVVADLAIGEPDDPEVSFGAEEGDDGLDDFAPVLEEAPNVDESVVRGLLRSMGGVLHHVAGEETEPEHWRFTPTEIDDIAPPLTRIINRRPQLRRAVMRGDEVAVAVALAGFVGRNITIGQQARKEDHDDVDREAPRSPGPPRAPAGGGDRPGQGRHGRIDGDLVPPADRGRQAR